MTRMTVEELEELQHPDSWEDAADAVYPAIPDPRAIVSVEFLRTEFAAIHRAAQEHGMTSVEFIRQSALERTRSSDTADEMASTSVLATGPEARTEQQPDELSG